jgi:hypothetical protein
LAILITEIGIYSIMELPANKNSGVYRIRNTINDKSYIGSAVNLYNRARKHRHELIQNKHGSPVLQNSWNKYGGDSFVFEILEIVNDRKDLILREQFYLDSENPEYNIRKIASSNLGLKASEETRKKMREAKLGEKAPWYGKKLSESAKELNRQAHTGKKASEETRAKMSASHKLRYIGKESPCKGRKQTEAEILKRVESRKKFYLDPANRQKHSLVIKKWWADRKNKNIKQ